MTPEATAALIEAETQEHHLHPYRDHDVCFGAGWIAPDGDYCERVNGHEGDHASFICSRCNGAYVGSEPDSHTWTVEEGHSDE